MVGSRARGTERENSDIDLVVLADAPNAYRSDMHWLRAIDWPADGRVSRWSDENYGVVWSRRIWIAANLEIEISFAPLSWADVAPLDAGTSRVVSDGCRILFDPDGYFERLTEAIDNQIGR